MIINNNNNNNIKGFTGVICKCYDFLPNLQNSTLNVAQNYYLCLLNRAAKPTFCYGLLLLILLFIIY